MIRAVSPEPSLLAHTIILKMTAHCVVVLEQDAFILAQYQEDPSLYNWKIVDGT